VHEVIKLGYRIIYNKDYASTNMVASLIVPGILDGPMMCWLYMVILSLNQDIKSSFEGRKPFCTAIDKSWLNLWRLRLEDPLSDAETCGLGFGAFAAASAAVIAGSPRWPIWRLWLYGCARSQGYGR